MRRLNSPMIFNRENWGLSDLDLKETILSADNGLPGISGKLLHDLARDSAPEDRV
jgi:hypothetical protein